MSDRPFVDLGEERATFANDGQVIVRRTNWPYLMGWRHQDAEGNLTPDCPRGAVKATPTVNEHQSTKKATKR